MKVALVGAELEENLGLRYMASALEHEGHEVDIVPFNTRADMAQAAKRIRHFDPQITGLSMVFTGRAREFCELARQTRDDGYTGHILAGGHFASFNCEQLLRDFRAFDSVALGEGEELICTLAARLDQRAIIPGLCFRRPDGSIQLNRATGGPQDLDALRFPKRTDFHTYFDRPIASILSSRGCWRDCAFCSINAWYERNGGGRKFRIRSVANIVAEMAELYHQHGVRIYNFQDDNFFLPSGSSAVRRFQALRDGLDRAGVRGIAIAVKARPDSISRESVAVLDDLGLFRVFLGVENACEEELQNLNRKCTFDEIVEALEILNDFDVHIAFNLLLFEPETTLEHIRTNLRFIERHVENPFNFCRAEAYAGTGLAEKLRADGILLGDYFGFDYRLKNPHTEAFHQVANYAFFDRNFGDFGLHYFNMEVDFHFQLLRRFHPELLTQSLRASVRNFIKRTNMDTYEFLAEIYDFVEPADPRDHAGIRTFARYMRQRVDECSRDLQAQGERLQSWMREAYEHRHMPAGHRRQMVQEIGTPLPGLQATPYGGLESLRQLQMANARREGAPGLDLLGVPTGAVPYDEFMRSLQAQAQEER